MRYAARKPCAALATGRFLSQAVARSDFAASVIELATNNLHIIKLEDWYDVSASELRKLAGFRGKQFSSSLHKVLMNTYPEHEWDAALLKPGSAQLVSQLVMERAVRKLFPKIGYFRNYRRLVGFVSEDDVPLEIDVFIPALKLGFEYQEHQHYFQPSLFKTSTTSAKVRDEYKCDLAKKLGVSLIIVPFWWDRSIESLAATILQARPELEQLINFNTDQLDKEKKSLFRAISREIPEEEILKHQISEIPEFGVLETASFVTNINNLQDLKNWILMEKFDGIRGFWHSGHQKMYSRPGNDLFVPDWLVACLSKISLEGELWVSRKSYYDSLRLAHTHNANWTCIRFVLFDCPSCPQQFSERISAVQQSCPSRHPFFFAAPMWRCESAEQIIEDGNRIMSLGGEGVMLRKSDSFYTFGISTNLQKFKALRDAEAKILSSTGLNSYLVEIVDLKNHPKTLTTEMSVSRHANLPAEELAAGTVVSFQYNHWKDKLPNSPQIFKIRSDLTWKEVLMASRISSGPKLRMPKLTSSLKRKSWRRFEDRKQFFDQFAASRGFDPLDHRSWSRVTLKTIHKAGGHGLLNMHFGGSLQKALRAIYPQMKPIKNESSSTSFQDLKKKKIFFDDFASKNGFDPLDGRSWSQISHRQVSDAGGYDILFGHFGGSLKRALLKVYPDLVLTQWKGKAVA